MKNALLLVSIFLALGSAKVFAQNETSKTIEYTCATKPFAHPYFSAHPGYKIVCSTLVSRSGAEPQSFTAQAPNQLWSEWNLVHGLCQKSIEVRGLTVSCQDEPL